MRKAAVFIPAALLASAAVIAQTVPNSEGEGAHRTTVSAEFASNQASAMRFLSEKRFERDLETPALGAMSQNDFRQRVAAIRAETPMTGVSSGQRGVTYDVIIQSGHYGRTTGAVGTSGSLVSERALNAYIADRIAQRLRSARLNVLLLPADGYLRSNGGAQKFNGLSGKAFVAIHSDGSPTACSTGPSLAYQRGTSPFAMHAIGYALSAALGYRYDQFRRDNFTADEAGYYMFRNVRTPRLTGLLEVGELTCAGSEKALIENADIVAANVAQALLLIATTSGPR